MSFKHSTIFKLNVRRFNFLRVKMNSKLRIKTKRKEIDGSVGEEEPLSPTAEYFSGKVISLCILAVMEFEIPFNFSCLLPVIQVLLPIFPRFSSIMVSDKGRDKWRRVEAKAQDHVIIPTFPEDLPVTEYDVHLKEYLTKIGMEPLSEDKPLWEFHAVNYPTTKAAATGIFKIHHSLGDGYSLMGAILSCFQRADDTSLPLTFPSTRREPEANDSSKGSLNVISRVSKVLCSIYDGLYDFGWSFAKSHWNVDDETSIRSGSNGVGFHPAVTISTVDLSLDKLKQIKTKLDVTINAVLTGIIFYGARLYMKETGESGRNAVSTMMVVLNTRDINGYKSIEEMIKAKNKLWGNQITYLHISLPDLTNQNCTNPLDFVTEAHKIILRKKNSPSVYLTGQFVEMVRKYKGSEAAAELIKGALKNSSIGFTNMIGPVEKMAFAKHPIKGFYYTVTGLHLSLLISAMSYMQTVRIGIGAELGFIDSAKFKSCMEQAFEQIYGAATSST